MLRLDSLMPLAGQLARSGGCVLIRPALTLAVMDDHSNAHYQIHIRGLLSDRLLSAFPELRASVRNHETVLDGSLPDQSALHGVLGRIESLGLELLEVRRVRTRAHKPSDADEPAEPEEPGVVAPDRASDNPHSSHSAGLTTEQQLETLPRSGSPARLLRAGLLPARGAAGARRTPQY